VSLFDWALALRLARRELRGGLRGFRVLVAAIALGVAAIAAVGSVGDSVKRALEHDGRLLLGGDVEVQLVQRPPSEAEAAWLRGMAAASSQVVEMRAMASVLEGRDVRAMVELKAVDASYPLSGAVELEAASAATDPLPGVLQERAGAWGALADPALLTKLGLNQGDRIRVGAAVFEVRGTVAREPDRVASVVSFGPRLLIADAALPATGLVQPGSLVRWKTRLLLPPQSAAAAFREAANAAFPEAGWQIRSTTDAAPGVERFVDRLTLFLSFAGAATLLIGGLGVAGAVGTYLERKIPTIATLKCLGAAGGLVSCVYLVQVLAIAAVGIGIGMLLGALAPLVALPALSALLPVAVGADFAARPLLQAAALGLLTALTFALLPLGRAGAVPAASLFRQEVVLAPARIGAGYLAATGACALALAALCIFATEDRGFAAWFVAGAMLTLLVLRAAALAVSAVCRNLPSPRSTALRLAVRGLVRPGAPTASVMMSLGAGLTVLVAVALIDSAIRGQIDRRLPEQVPAFFFIDIQDDQAEDFDRLVEADPGVAEFRRVPALRGRIVAIKDIPVETAVVAPESAWAVRGDRALTYATTPPEDARITGGAWWLPDYHGPPLVSLDAGLARGFGVDVGDRLTLNVLGRELTVAIASLREIEWRAVPFDFALILSPGVLAGAPHTHIAAVYAGAEGEDRLERAITGRFDNVTAIRTREALKTVEGLLKRIGWGARAAAVVTLAAGILVLAGAIAADHHRRRQESVIFKVLGAGRARIAYIYGVEYGLLGAVTAVVAALLGTAVAWAVVTKVMNLGWVADPGLAAATAATAIALTLAAGLVGTLRLLRERAAPLLRNE
jgi:putative ABC transport system permease protein